MVEQTPCFWKQRITKLITTCCLLPKQKQKVFRIWNYFPNTTTKRNILASLNYFDEIPLKAKDIEYNPTERSKNRASKDIPLTIGKERMDNGYSSIMMCTFGNFQCYLYEECDYNRIWLICRNRVVNRNVSFYHSHCINCLNIERTY